MKNSNYIDLIFDVKKALLFVNIVVDKAHTT